MSQRRRVSLKFRNKDFFIEVVEAKGLKKFTGLMFRSSGSENLLFDFSSWEIPAIHSFFVFFKFLAVWVDEKNCVVETTIVKPFRPYVAPSKRAKKLLELPFNDDNKKIIDFLVGKKDLNRS